MAKNVLNMVQIVALSKYIERNKEKLESDAKFASKANTIASQELNFVVTRPNFQSVAQASGVSLAERCVNMAKVPKTNNERLRILAKAVLGLYQNSGKEVPVGIKNIIRNQAVSASTESSVG